MGADGRELDIAGVGNAIVDVLSDTDDEVIFGHGLAKGSMTLIDGDRADALYAGAGTAVEASGGSSANTAVVAASFGAHVAYIGKLRDDTLGDTFARNITAANVLFDTPRSVDGPGTDRCLVMVSPDGQPVPPSQPAGHRSL